MDRHKIIYILSLLHVVAFLLILVIDYINYDPVFTSAPFFTYILVRGFEFILPALLLFIVGMVLKSKK